ncbi:MAG: hypothetical protein QOI83_301 [Streptomycetaceae bacterium]|jgi:hypothetical protein|nr:hypothetical protein [Streptomycetaceae bacterium]
MSTRLALLFATAMSFVPSPSKFPAAMEQRRPAPVLDLDAFLALADVAADQGTGQRVRALGDLGGQ